MKIEPEVFTHGEEKERQALFALIAHIAKLDPDCLPISVVMTRGEDGDAPEPTAEDGILAVFEDTGSEQGNTACIHRDGSVLISIGDYGEDIQGLEETARRIVELITEVRGGN